MSRILISGGTGFIGSYLIPLLESKDDTIFVLTRNELNSLRNNISFVNFNFLSDSSFSNILKEISPDIFIHLAWDVRSPNYSSNSINYLWYKRSLELCKMFLDSGGKRIIVAGTCYEYDFSVNSVLTEDSVCFPITLYGKCKNALHEELLFLSKKYKSDLIWTRIFFPYGKGEEKRKFISYLFDCINKDRKLLIKQPDDVIDYIHVSDIARALEMLLYCNCNGVFNICSGNKVMVKDIVNYITQKFAKNIPIECSKNCNSKYIVGDPTKLTKLGFKCKYDIYKGIDTYFIS